jgi:hypothetical protein
VSEPNDFFQESVRLWSDADPNVAYLSESLYHRMLAETRRGVPPPLAGFNILYFCQAVIRAWFATKPELQPTSADYLFASGPIHAVNLEHSFQWRGARATLVQKFLELVRTESVPLGNDFDVAYALEIIFCLFDDNADVIPPPRDRTARDMTQEELDALWT